MFVSVRERVCGSVWSENKNLFSLRQSQKAELLECSSWEQTRTRPQGEAVGGWAAASGPIVPKAGRPVTKTITLNQLTGNAARMGLHPQDGDAVGPSSATHGPSCRLLESSSPSRLRDSRGP